MFSTPVALMPFLLLASKCATKYLLSLPVMWCWTAIVQWLVGNISAGKNSDCCELEKKINEKA